MKNTILKISILAFFLNVTISNAQDPYIGEVEMFAGNFAPSGYAFCNGQLLAISSNTALFSILGTMYGGDGRTTFGLPDLRGRVPNHAGNGPGLSNRSLASMGGTETNVLNLANLPAHTHTVNTVSGTGDSSAPSNNLLANTGLFDTEYSTSTTQSSLDANAIGITGQSQAVNNMQPYTTVNFIIALVGIYPSRS